MTKEQRQKTARLAYAWLSEYITWQLDEPLRSDIQCLLDEFKRLDDKEQAQVRAGRKHGKLGAEHGAKGGRPKKNIT